MIIKNYNVIMTKTYDIPELRINLCKFCFYLKAQKNFLV